MATTITGMVGSGSTNGRLVKVTGTDTAGAVTLYTAHATDTDEVWLWANNTSASGVKLTIECGGTTDPDDLLEYTVPAEDGAHLILPGWRFTGSVLVKAFAATANVLNCKVDVNRINVT